MNEGANYAEGSHNTMHNNFGTVLNNSVYSVTSLVFYPYHSWIDAQVEMKIRKSSNNKEYLKLYNFLTE